MKIATIALLALASTSHAQSVFQLQWENNSQQRQINALSAQVVALQGQVAAIACNRALQLGPFVYVNASPENGVCGPNIHIVGANLHVESGSGATDDHGYPVGKGNLIVGYATLTNGLPRTGSHNVILGDASGWAATGSLIVGWGDYSGGNSNVIFGSANYVLSYGSTILGGVNQYSPYPADSSTIVGGNGNVTSGGSSVVLGGKGNVANGFQSVIVGGTGNQTNTSNQILP